MRVLLVGPDLEENLSLRYLAASLSAAGHTSQIATFDSKADLPRVLDAARGADLVGLSMCFQVRAREFLELAAALKSQQRARPVVAGGHYASCAAAELLANHRDLDAVVVHEGERTLVELADLPRFEAVALQAVRGVVFRDATGAVVATSPRPTQEDLDALPFPDRTGPSRLVAGVPTAYLMGSRGCLSNCDYCCISTLHRLAPGKRFRQRDPENVADEMAALYHDRGVRQFVFHDDNFLVPSVEKNLSRIEALDHAMRKRGLRHVGLVLKCRPGDADRRVFQRLREMGLLRVFLGIESGSEAGLCSIGRKQTVEDAHRALSLCEELEISSQYTLITFHPEATLASLRADLAFARAHLSHPFSFCRAEAYAGTPLERRMIDEGRAQGDYLARTYRYTEPSTSLLWDVSRDLLRERCWTQDNLQGQAIRLDHQAAVLRHFHDGREVDRVVGDFLAWELDTNRSTVELMEELYAAFEACGCADSPKLRERVADISRREAESRSVLQDRACTLREALRDTGRALSRFTLPRPPARKQPLPVRAAAVLAAGMLGCIEDGGVYEAPPPPDGSYLHEDGGVYEAPPPPIDAGVAMTDAAAPPEPDADVREDAGVVEAPPPPVDAAIEPREDGGVIEAPPPPVDAGVDPKEDAGVIEAPPPPVDGGK